MTYSVFRWSALRPGEPYKRCSPTLVELRSYMQRRWGGLHLGCLADPPRTVRGGSSWSTHSFGAAWDWGYRVANGGPGLVRVESEVLPFLTANAHAIGIQVVHHYMKWSSGPFKGANRWTIDDGWYTANVGSGGEWLHIEVHPSRFADATSIEQRLGAAPPPVLPPFNPEVGQWSLWPLVSKPTVRIGSAGDPVRYLQGVLKLKAGQSQIGLIDGVFGPKTEGAVLNLQRFFTPNSVDGVVGQQTWKVIDWLAGV